MDFNRKLSMLMAALLTIAALASGFGLIGMAAAETVVLDESDTVLEDENATVTVDVTGNSTMTDPANETASVYFYNASEYADDPSTATVVTTETIDVSEGNTTTATYDSSTPNLELDTEYHVTVEADDTEVDSASISAPGSGGALFGGSNSSLAIVAVLAVAAVVLLAKDGEN